jgi:hypothetical protein
MAFSQIGQWEKSFQLKNVAVHASLLPTTGKVLYWGRRSNPKDPDPNSASWDEQATKTFLLDPNTGTSVATKFAPKQGVNLFCSGHCLQPDGTVMVVGGHIKDGVGANQACVFDPDSETWSDKPQMNAGRWYPSALTLPDGGVFCMSGSSHNDYVGNPNSQIWNNKTWLPVTGLSNPPPLYPKMHVGPTGQVFITGPQAQLQVLIGANSTGGVGTWKMMSTKRAAAWREYAPSVMYDKGKVIFIGGGVDSQDTSQPTKKVELIDLNDTAPKWTAAADMNVERTHHNATVLPDGTVLVTGGTKGTGFNNLGGAQHQAELWDPNNPLKWTNMASEDTDRCYHSIALLLPDGRVLSAGSGEGGDAMGVNSHTEAQIFRPPYLFKGTRPAISQPLPPSNITYGQPFDVTVTIATGDSIKNVSWVRIGSVTHCANMNQSFMKLDFDHNAPKITVHAPTNANLAPPGHYMLFVLNQLGVPSVAHIMRIGHPAAHVLHRDEAVVAKRVAMAKDVEVDFRALDQKVIAEQGRAAVVVGITPACPYGLGPCWSGAFHGLEAVNDVAVVRPMPSQADSVAFVYLKQDVLPDIDVWRREFEAVANTQYVLRGIEMTLSGLVAKKHLGAAEQLALAGTSTRVELFLAPFQAASKIEWDRVENAPKPVSDAEAGAYERLFAALADHPAGLTAQVTGRLQKHGDHTFSLEVRDFKVDAAA